MEYFNVPTPIRSAPQVQCYDPEENTWMLRANIPIAKRCITAVALNNLIYVAGGLTKSIYCYDPQEDYWMHVVHTFSKLVMILTWERVVGVCSRSPSSLFNPPSRCWSVFLRGFQAVNNNLLSQ